MKAGVPAVWDRVTSSSSNSSLTPKSEIYQQRKGHGQGVKEVRGEEQDRRQERMGDEGAEADHVVYVLVEGGEGEVNSL